MKNPSEPALAPIERLQKSLALIQSRTPNFPLEDVLLSRLIHFSNRSFEQVVCETLAPHGVLLSQWMVLALLYGAADYRRRPQELSCAIGQSGPNTTKTTLFLISKEWVKRIPDPENRRSCWMELTTSGRKWVEQVMPSLWVAYQAEISPLDKQERKTLTQLLMKMLSGKKQTCTSQA